MEIIARLREEREALVARVAEIDKMLRQYEQWGREAQRLLSLTGALNERSVMEPIDSDGLYAGAQHVSADDRKHRVERVVVGAVKRTPMPEFEAAVIDVLRESARPMDRVELYEALTARGIVIGDGEREKELNALSARVYRMSRDPKNRILSARGQGYRLMTDEDAAIIDGIKLDEPPNQAP